MAFQQIYKQERNTYAEATESPDVYTRDVGTPQYAPQGQTPPQNTNPYGASQLDETPQYAPQSQPQPPQAAQGNPPPMQGQPAPQQQPPQRPQLSIDDQLAAAKAALARKQGGQ
jgi:hypothetical protein